jgi:hypothetical protein
MNQHHPSWIKLLSFFTVTTLGLSLIMAAVFASVTVALAVSESPQVSEPRQTEPDVTVQSFSGVITDSKCGPRHMTSAEGASDCVRTCVRNGSRYILVDGERTYRLHGDLPQLSELAGQRVRLVGVLNKDTIQINPASLLADDRSTETP